MTSALQMAFIAEATASSTPKPAPWQRSSSPMRPRRLDSRSGKVCSLFVAVRQPAGDFVRMRLRPRGIAWVAVRSDLG